jgi:L-ascorbate metabolism protein UlaG (beta-lactamase superfamily)
MPLRKPAGLAALLLVLACASGCWGGARYRGPDSDHFDGSRFSNLSGVERPSVRSEVFYHLFSGHGAWPDHVEVDPCDRPPKRVGRGELRYTWITHNTVLIQTDGMNILTDPIWSKRASPWRVSGPRRVSDPALAMDDLPPIDLILVTHNHYDHMDLPTLLELQERFHPRVLAGLGDDAYLRGKGLADVAGMDWWDTARAGRLRVHFVPAQHFSGRGLGDANRSLWGGFVIESSWGRTYVVGDTGYGDFFRLIRRRIGTPDLTLIPIGVYEPRELMRLVHISPRDAVMAHVDLGSRRTVGIHYGTFSLGSEGYDDPVYDLAEALAEIDTGDTAFSPGRLGEAVTLKAAR